MKRNRLSSVCPFDKTLEVSVPVKWTKNQTPFQIIRKCNAICVWWVIMSPLRFFLSF